MAATGNKIYLRKVGSSAGKVAAKPATFSELLAVATRKLDLAAPATRIFSTNGDEYEADDYGLIEKDEILYISCGSDFVPPAATQAASSVVAPIAAPVALSAVQNPVIAVPVTSATSSMPAPELEPVQVDLDQATLEQPVDASQSGGGSSSGGGGASSSSRGGAASLQPSPSLSSDQVVAQQIMALRAEDADEGIARCFAFSAPEQRAITPQLSQYAAMLRGPDYRILLTSRQAFASELPPPKMPGEDAPGEDEAASPKRARYALLFTSTTPSSEQAGGNGGSAGSSSSAGSGASSSAGSGASSSGSGGSSAGSGGGSGSSGDGGGSSALPERAGGGNEAAPPAIRFFAFRWELSLQSGGEHDGCWLTNAIQFLGETPAGASPESYLSSVPYLLPKKLKQFMV